MKKYKRNNIKGGSETKRDAERGAEIDKERGRKGDRETEKEREWEEREA